jgi:hypothetical protein
MDELHPPISFYPLPCKAISLASPPSLCGITTEYTAFLLLNLITRK